MDIPESLREPMSKELINLVLDSKDKNAVSPDIAKRIIYLWRQDGLSSDIGLKTLISAAIAVDVHCTSTLLKKYGLVDISVFA